MKQTELEAIKTRQEKNPDTNGGKKTCRKLII